MGSSRWLLKLHLHLSISTALMRPRRPKQYCLQLVSYIYIYIYIYLANGFHVAVRLFSNRSQMTSKCGKNKKVAHEAQPSVSLMFLPHFHVLCDLLLNRRTATWNLFISYNKKIKIEFSDLVAFSQIRQFR